MPQKTPSVVPTSRELVHSGSSPIQQRIQDMLSLAIVRPFRLESYLIRSQTPAQYGLQGTKLRTEVSPGLFLYGWHVRQAAQFDKPKGTAVILHGISSCKEANIWLAARFSEWGYQSLLYDQRAHGRSGGSYCTYGYYEKHDISRFLDEAEKQFGPLGPVVVWGTSLGGAIALQVMETDDRIRCGLVESTFTTLRKIAKDFQKKIFKLDNTMLLNWALEGAERVAKFPVDQIRPIDNAARVKQPVLIVHGIDDEYISIEYGRKLYEKLTHPGKGWLEIQGGNHHLYWNKGGEAYLKAHKNFLDQYCA